MTHVGFLSNSNAEMLWNIIMDNVVMSKKLNETTVIEVRTIFRRNLSPFYETEIKNTNDLVVLNKKYIMWMLNNINNIIDNNNKIPQGDNILTGSNKVTPKLITVEDIHKNRQTKFEQELSERQQEFTNFMTVKTPEVPKFSIDLNDEVPIKELEQTIKQMAAQRNYDVDMINKTNMNPVDAQNWLTPTETSIKNDKYTPIKKDSLNEVITNKVKYIKIDTINLDSSQHNNVVDLNKHITWKDQMPKTNESVENNIFKKLKKIDITDIATNDIATNDIATNDIKRDIIIMQTDITNLNGYIQDINNKIGDMHNTIFQILKLLNKTE